MMITKDDCTWMLFGAACAIGICPGKAIVLEIAGMCRTLDDAFGAIEAMRKATDNNRIFAARDYLRFVRSKDAA